MDTAYYIATLLVCILYSTRVVHCFMSCNWMLGLWEIYFKAQKGEIRTRGEGGVSKLRH